jgi:hypothetical protein
MDHYTPFGTKNEPETPSDELPEDEEFGLDQEEPGPEDQPARLAYLKSIMPPKGPKRKGPVTVFVVVAVLVIAGGIVGGFLYDKHSKTTKAEQKNSTEQTISPSSNSIVSTTKHYISNGNDLNLDFDYPSNWTVSPPSNDNPNDNTITLNSPLTSITSAGGTQVTGKVTVSIRPGSDQLSELSSGTATAGQTSVQISYADPTADQYQYPYLTFIHFAAGPNPSQAFEEVLISGNTPYTQGTSLTESSISVDPIISASFYDCLTKACTGSDAVLLSITNNSWQNETIFQQTLTLLESMQLN